MPEANTIQTNFTAGEISPYLKGRTDLQKFSEGAELLDNFIVKPQGGLFARTGTKFITEVPNDNQFTRVVEFEFSDTQEYILVLAQNQIQFIKNYQLLYVMAVPVSVVTPYLSTDLSELQFTQSADVLYITHPSYPPAMLERFSDTNWTYTVFPNVDGPYLDENTTDTSVSLTGYNDTALLTSTNGDFSVGSVGKFVEYYAPTSAGNKVIATITGYISPTQVNVTPHDNCLAPIDPTSTLTYAAPNLTASEAIWSNANIGSYVRDYAGNWYLITGFTSTAVVIVNAPVILQATAGVLTLTNRTITATVSSSSPIFTLITDVGRHMRFNLLASQFWGNLTAVGSTSSATINLDSSIPLNPLDPTKFLANAQTVLWRLGAWGATTGYPSCVTFFGERLVFSATPLQPQTTWMSNDGDYENFAPTQPDSSVLDSNSITFTIASNKVNTIKWLNGGPNLVIGTIGAEWLCQASTQADAVTPTNITVTQQSAYGSRNLRTYRVGATLLYAQRSGIKIMEQAYDFYTGLLLSRDITLLSEHILREGGGPIVDMTYQQSRNGILWMVRADGVLVGCTLNKVNDIYAWHAHHIAGGDVGTGAGIVESVACIHDEVGDVEDAVYMVVRRIIAGVLKRSIEYLSLEYDATSPTDQSNFCYVDCAVTYNGAPTNVCGNALLANQIVAIVADGAFRGIFTTSNLGIVTFPGLPASKIQVGLMYTSTLTTLPPEGGNPLGTAQGKTKRVHKMQVRLYNSMGFQYKGDGAGQITMYNFRKTGDPMNLPPQLRTRDQDLTVESNYSRTGSVTIVRNEPYPLNILAVMPMFVTNE